MATSQKNNEKERITIRFAGDSGDGMQLTGTQFSLTAALFGNDLATLPDFPAEIRAPAGTPEGVSGYQVQIGATDIHTPGDKVDVLAALNPAALVSSLKRVQPGGIIIVNTDGFTKQSMGKANLETNPLEDGSLSGYHVVKAPVTTLTKKALEDMPITTKDSARCKNMFVLGMVYWLFGRSLDHTEKYLDVQFRKSPTIAAANKKALRTGYHFAETIEAMPASYQVPPAPKEKGAYRHITGNTAVAWGLIAAAEKMGKKLVFASYPITPASDILHEMARRSDMDVTVFQAEDEIAAVCAAIGAGYAGQLGVTASSGPGIALKGEAIGLAVMAETPLVVVDVQRGGPSTGLPTKTEQADMNLALYGRNGESPAIVLAASAPGNCFEMAYMAAKLTVEHTTPVMLLTDGYLANGATPWRFPRLADLPPIAPPKGVKKNGAYMPYRRDPETLARHAAAPGTPGWEHRIGGLEKQHNTGNISYDPQNHEKMVHARAEKVKRVARRIPLLKAEKTKGQLLVVGWGGSYGSLSTATKALQREGKDIEHAHFNYINPLPRNTEKIVKGFVKIVVCELNNGQFASYLRSHFPRLNIVSYTKIQGQPFTLGELTDRFLQLLKE